jgi:hypothetical protein
MNNEWFDFEISEEAIVEYDGSKKIDAGEHKVTLQEVYLLPSNSSDAKAFVVSFKYANGKIGTEKFWYINSKTGTQRTPEGKPTFGSLQIREFLGALGIEASSLKPTAGSIVLSQDKTIDTQVFRELYGKEITVVVQLQEEPKWNDPSIIYTLPGVIGWYNPATRQNYKERANGLEAKDIASKLKRAENIKKAPQNQSPAQSVDSEAELAF